MAIIESAAQKGLRIRAAMGGAAALLLASTLAGCDDPPLPPVPSLDATTSDAASDASAEAGDGGDSSLDAPVPVEEPVDVGAADVRVVDLAPDQIKLLCDWNAQVYGGYGGQLSCPGHDGGLAAPFSPFDCVSVMEFDKWGCNCPLTVTDYMACVDWQIQTHCAGAGPDAEPPSCVTQYGPSCIGSLDASRAACAMPSLEGGSEAATGDAGDAGSGDGGSDATNDAPGDGSGDGPREASEAGGE